MKEKILHIISKSLKVDLKLLEDNFGPGDIPEWDSLANKELILANNEI